MRYTTEIDPRIQFDSDSVKHWIMPTFIKFCGPVNEPNAEKFRDDLMHAEDHALKSNQSVLPIIIDSYGGEVYSLLSMIDAIKSCKIKIATIVEGKAMSAGAALFSCGTEGYRFIEPCATVMIHEVSSWSEGKNDEIKVKAEETDRLNAKIFSIMAANCKQKKDYFLKLVHQNNHADWYLDAEECVKHNLANRISIPGFKVKVKMETEFEF